MADAGIEKSCGDEIEIFPVVVEDRIVVVVEAAGNFGSVFGFERIDKDIVRAATMRLGVGEPAAVGRPSGIADVAVIAFVDQDGRFVCEAYLPDAMGFVPVEQLLDVLRLGRSVAGNAA